MTQQIMSMKKNGFVHSGVSNYQDENYSPIYAYRNLTVTTLDEAIKNLVLYVPSVEAFVKKAKKDCYQTNIELILDESAAIYLYTMPTSFHSKLNDRLRAGDRQQLEPWFAFLKLFITALGKLPSLATTVWRGVSSIISSDFIENPTQTWWTVNSCSRNPRVIEFYLGGLGTVFGIETMYGKDIAKYSACPDEEEIVLMPGTRVRLIGQPLEVMDKPYIISLKECGVIPEGKHVMFSYHQSSQEYVAEICRILQDEHIPVWFNEYKDIYNIHNSLADGVENAAIICCFLTPDYENSVYCKFELKYAQKRSKIIIPYLLSDPKAWKPTDWLKFIITGLESIDFDDLSQSSIDSIARDLIVRITYESPALPHFSSKTSDIPSYLFELIRYEYQRNGHIKRLMNPAKSFPIEQSYINLAIIETKKQQEKEKQLRDAPHIDAIMGSFEEIYGTKTVIDIKNIFETCKNQEKQVLIFGRAGIGKSTFCRYVAYQWATNSYWPQYELLALIPLRRLTVNRYPSLPPGQSYSLIDLVKKEVFPYDLSESEDKLLKKHFDAKKTLWILDGYDEIVQNVPPHLECLFEQLLNTPHHILTSRPYQNTLAYHVQMEITGFTDENIQQYVQQFFDQMRDELDDTSIKSQKLFSFLQMNPSIWGVAHIPVNLELICCLWSNQDLSETKEVTMTALYTMMTEWLCRRYLSLRNNQFQNLSQDEINQQCKKELTFLESVAFNGMKSNTIILRPNLLKKAFNEAKVSLLDHPHILNIGILKSFHTRGVGIQIETGKDHYFVHLSFQEYFAARYLFNALSGSEDQKTIAIKFIQTQKYNQRYTLVYTFLSGLCSENETNACLNIFWETILTSPLDLVGIRHLQLVISCLEETFDQPIIPWHTDLLEWIAKCIKYNLSIRNKIILSHLSQILRRAQSIVSNQGVLNVFINLLENDDPNIKIEVLSFIYMVNVLNPPVALIYLVTNALDLKIERARDCACKTLGKMGEKAATTEVITKLVSVLGDESKDVRCSACLALGNIGEKAATNEVITELVSALGDESRGVRCSVCEALGKMGEKAATNEVITELVSALGDEDEYVRRSACGALGKIGEKAATDEVITKLVSALGDENEYVRESVCEALSNIGEKAATNEVITKLVSTLGDESRRVRRSVCEALGKIGEKAGTNEVITKLVSALGDENEYVRESVCEALSNIGEKAGTNEVITMLVSTLGDDIEYVRESVYEALSNIDEKAVTDEVITMLVSTLGDERAYFRRGVYEALGKIGEKAATNEVITKLLSALGDESEDFRRSACRALGKMGEKAATNEVITKLVNVLGDESEDVRCSACKALGKMGEKAATTEVITKLVNVLGDESEDVRCSACLALGKMGEKAGTNEVITELVSALGDESKDVRWLVCEALGKMGEKAATNEVLTKLVNVLGDESEDVRSGACKALGKIGEKAATNEVITKLVSALGDENEYVRETVCEALGKMGEKAATNEVITKLMSTLGDKSEYFRRSVCGALGNIGKKAATNEVITKLMSALGDENEYVRESVCEAVGNIGEKATTNEVITELVSALGDESENVRWSVCIALWNMGEKAATNEVITKLVDALEDESDVVRLGACTVLRKIGEKAVTNEVIAKLVSALEDGSDRVRSGAHAILEKIYEKALTLEVTMEIMTTYYLVVDEYHSAAHTIDDILSSSLLIFELDPKLITKLCLSESEFKCLKSLSMDEFMKKFFTTENADWLFVITCVTLQNKAAVSVTEDTLVVYDKREPLELHIPNLKIYHGLVEAFTDQAKRLHLCFEIPSNVSNKC